MKFYLKLGFNLMIVCAIAAAGLSITYSLTKNAIEKNKKLKTEQAYKAVMPQAKTFKSLGITKVVDKVEIKEVSDALDGKNKLGIVALVQTRGYGGSIQLAVGIDNNGKVTGINVINQNETPGLGNKILDPVWQKQFAGKSSSDDLEVKKDIKPISGATISSKAVTEAVKTALQTKIGKDK